MLTLNTTLHNINASRNSATTRLGTLAPSHRPRMYQRARRQSPLPLGGPSQRATYYFDASWHTGKTLRHLTQAAVSDQTPFENGASPAKEFLVTHTDNFLWSLRPGAEEEIESKALFIILLEWHLSNLEEEELAQFQCQLNAAQYACHVTESEICDVMYLEYGFSNGPPQTITRTLLTQPHLNLTLENLQEQAHKEGQISPRLRLPDALAKSLRDQISGGAGQWADSQKSLDGLKDIAQTLATLLEMPEPVHLCISRTVGANASTVMWSEGHLLLDRSIADALSQDDSGKLFARVQRDLLENFLLRRYFSDVADIRKASPVQRRQVWRAIEQVESHAPTIQLSDAVRAQIRQLMAARGHLGSVQISPTAGAALGHSWIAPSLSLMPDHHQPKQSAGTRYMQSGFHTEPRETVINEWPIRWLTLAESERLYPAQAAWHQPVAVDALQLSLAAETLRRDWTASKVRYRFADLSTSKPATGCRVSVWESVRNGMTPAIRAVFDHYNQGLCLPDSSTELRERLRHFMGWLEKIAAD